MGLGHVLLRRRYKRWDCLQYAVDNKCPEWETYAKETRESTSDEMPLIRSTIC